MVAGAGGVIKGTVFERLNEYESTHNFEKIESIFRRAKKLRGDLEMAIGHIKQKDDSIFSEFHARRIVEMATDTIISYLLCIDAIKDERKEKVCTIFVGKAEGRVKQHMDYILSDDLSIVENHTEIIDT